MISIVEGLTGRIVTPCSTEYDEARQEWNRAIQEFPAVIVYCQTTKDIQNAVLWARRQNIAIRIRSGGHHYQGYSTGNGVLIIDVSEMVKIRLNETASTVYMQGGVQNRQVYEYLGARGYPFPGGTCPTVGVSGYVLGGGWGYSSRYLGLGCDSLLGLELVNYQGELLRADKSHNPDLFWACKGAGGGNFGVVTAMTFRLPPKEERVTLVELVHPDASTVTMRRFLDTWQNWLVGLDPRITINASLYSSAEDGMGIYGKGLFYGSAEEAEQILSPFQQGGAAVALQELTFPDAMQKIMDTYPDSEKFQSTGRFVDRKYSAEELEAIVKLISQRAEGSVFAAVSVYALGGRVREVSKERSAFYYRDAAYILGIQSVWEDNDYASVNRCWLWERFQYLKQLTAGSYINFPYNCLPHFEEEYYGANACRLQSINRQYDPMAVFSFPQAIL